MSDARTRARIVAATADIRSPSKNRRCAMVAALLALTLGACASSPRERADAPRADAPYVGVFTGTYVDGRPVYRLPAIHVVGSRAGLDGS